jgi:hypothetical protein
VRGALSLPDNVALTAWSVSTLQEQTIIADAPGAALVSIATISLFSRGGNQFQSKKLSL